jgi:uncharacterized protein YodC (DUF2158 family)
MSEIRLEPGIKCRLKSGGPIMTIEDVEHDDDGRTWLSCVWIDHNEQPQQRRFAEEVVNWGFRYNEGTVYIDRT